MILWNDLTVDGWRFYSWKYGWPASPYAYPILFHNIMHVRPLSVTLPTNWLDVLCLLGVVSECVFCACC